MDGAREDYDAARGRGFVRFAIWGSSMAAWDGGDGAMGTEPAVAALFDPEYYLQQRPDLVGTDVNLLEHYLVHGWRESALPHVLFDPAFYLQQRPALLAEGIEPFGHYLDQGWREGLSPHPLFDGAHCRAPDASPGNEMSPLSHYARTGWQQGASPHPLFDPAFYQAQLPGPPPGDLFRHFVTEGWRLGLRPHPLFDPGYYLSEREDLAGTGIEPLQHYVRHGWAEGGRPHPLFDPTFYLAQAPELTATEPLAHYLRQGWQEGRAPHPLFDPAFYRAQLSEPPDRPDVLHYLDHASHQMASPSPLVDEVWYRATYHDNAAIPALLFYLHHGWRHGQTPHPYFSVEHYRAQLPQPGMPDMAHYLRHGEGAGLRPNPAFSPIFYRAMHGARMGSEPSPLVHYILRGEAAGLPTAPEFRGARYASRYLAYAADRRPMRHYLWHGRALGWGTPLADWPGPPRPAFDGVAHQALVILVGPAEADARQGQLTEAGGAGLPVEADGGVRPCGIGWVLQVADADALAAWMARPPELPPHTPVVLVAGEAHVARPDILRLAAEAALGRPAHPMVVDRAGDVFHAGFTTERMAVPRGVGADPAHPDLAYARSGLATAGPVVAARLAAVLDAGRAWDQELGLAGLFLGISGAGDGRFLPAAQAVLPDQLPGHSGPAAVPLPHAPVPEARRPRMLLIDSIVPRAGFDAGSHYALQLMEMFGEYGYDVTLLPDADLDGAPEAVVARGIRVIQAPFAQSSEQYIAGATDEFAVVVMSRVTCGGRHMEALRAKWPGARLVFHPGDLHHLRLVREAVLRDSVDLFQGALDVKRRELAIAREADATVVVSEHELSVLRDAGVGGHAVRIDPEYANRPPAPYVPASRHGVAFIGGYNHQPNVDAVRFLCERIWPLVSAARPDIPLLIVGSDPPPEFAAYAGPSVQVRGFVPDLDGLLDTVRMTVAPLRYGAGVKMKLISSLAAGVPALCSEIAAEGTGLEPGAGFVLADTAEACAAAVLRLYDD